MLMPSPARQTCPFMLRTFIRPGSHSEIHLFNPTNPAQQRAEHSLYVWKDLTLRELVILLRSVNPTTLGKGNARFSVRHVYAASDRDRDRDARRQEWDYRDLGLVFARDLTGKNPLHSEGHGRSGGRNDPSNKTLEQHRFIPGDFIEVAYMSPTAAGPQSGAATGAGGIAASGPAGNNIPSMSIQGRAGGLSGRLGAVPSEADQAWGVAGEQRQRPFGRGAGNGPSGGNRFNPLLSGRGGMSIMGQSRRRQSQTETNGGANGQRAEDRDGDANMD